MQRQQDALFKSQTVSKDGIFVVSICTLLAVAAVPAFCMGNQQLQAAHSRRAVHSTLQSLSFGSLATFLVAIVLDVMSVLQASNTVYLR